MKLKAFLLGLVLVGAAPQAQAKAASGRVFVGSLSLVVGAMGALTTEYKEWSGFAPGLIVGGVALIVNKLADSESGTYSEDSEEDIKSKVYVGTAAVAVIVYAVLGVDASRRLLA